jgi:hypothetical protein
LSPLIDWFFSSCRLWILAQRNNSSVHHNEGSFPWTMTQIVDPLWRYVRGWLKRRGPQSVRSGYYVLGRFIHFHFCFSTTNVYNTTYLLFVRTTYCRPTWLVSKIPKMSIINVENCPVAIYSVEWIMNSCQKRIWIM